MVCIYCGSKTNIINSRTIKKTGQKWRRHKCPQCDALFTSIEDYSLESCLMVRSKSNKPEPFCRDKLFLSIYQSISHLNNSVYAANELTQTIINKLIAKKPLAPIINTNSISCTALKVLKRYNAAAAVYYASLRQSIPLANDVKRVLRDSCSHPNTK
jgi:transcriptional regulator NrdR family protein